MGKQRINRDFLQKKAAELAQERPTKHGGRDRPTENKVVGTERRN